MQQLFMDMAVMIEAQGEILTQIEVHVTSAVKDTESGTKSLGEAIKIQKKTRKVCKLMY